MIALDGIFILLVCFKLKCFFHAGNVDPAKTSVKIKSSIVVLRPVLPASVILDECDKFGNKVESSEETLSKYLFTVTKVVC